MYLKSLEIRGFKSFADRTELFFKSGITGVVGPNGSGKSNIADAVRWVLGEQSVKQLRGGKMEDVIFAGTQYRKSLGQAQVSMTLDNSCGTLPLPYNEVTVTRRLYRSGESEYLINNSNVRLRDIHELFMDTGIGKEGYSIIGQGKIDAILSGKAEERRSLIEEAAGITKYKSRKEEGEKKLKNAEENLVRVTDIISTYEERIEPLRIDKEKAEKFLVLSEELKGLQVSLIVSDLKDGEEKNRGITEAMESAKKVFQEVNERKTQEEEHSSILEEALLSITREKEKAKEEYYLSRGTLDEVRNDLRFGETRLSGDAEKLKLNISSQEENEKRAEALKSKEKEAEDKIITFEEALNKVNSEFYDLKKKSLEIENELLSHQERSSFLKADLEKIQASQKETEKKLTEEKSRSEYLMSQKNEFGSVMENFRASLKLNEEATIKVDTEINDLSAKEDSLNSMLSDGAKDIAERREIIAQTEDKLTALKREYGEARAKSVMLKNLEESYEGYNRSVKDLMQYLKTSKSPHFKDTAVVGEIIKTDTRYSKAIEAALGGYIGNIITSTDSSAKELIGILKAKNLGRCTFLPRNVIKAQRIKMPVFKANRVLGFASDLVETDEIYREIIDSILARTLVVENMDDAVSAARETSYRIKIVTLDGDIISSGGAMTGGSQKGQKSGIISRKSELEDMERIMAETENEGRKTSEILNNLKEELARVIKAQDEKKYELHDVEIDLSKLKERKLGFTRDIERILGLIEEQKKEETDISELLEKAGRNMEILNEELLGISEKARDSANEIDEIRRIRTEKFALSDRMRDEMTEVRVRITEAERDLKEEQTRRDETRSQIEETIRKKEDLLSEKEILETVITQIGNEIEELKKKASKIEADMESLDKKSTEKEAEETKYRSMVKDQNAQLSVLREEFYRAEKEHYKAELQYQKYAEERDSLLSRLNEDLNLTLAEAKEMAFPIESRTKTRKRVSELKNSITALGNINLSSIEEYEKVTESYRFLSSQRDDLNKAREELNILIADMTSKMKKLFTENFAILSSNFKDTFRMLFSGGNAELVLGDGDEISGNIDIIVQPPGKKLQNLNLLSGGEKVLSAIALTFAILRMKPSPFCLLDEIEAALDDANVYKYAGFLREFAKDTQFILITHRKGTMESADMLYGVTMEEKGVSKIVSVDLEKIKE